MSLTLPSMKRLALAPLAVLLALAISPALANSGRSHGRCMQTCTYIRAACDLRCDDDCSSMYSGDPALFEVCLGSCRLICAEYDQEYRQICRQSNSAPVPTEP